MHVAESGDKVYTVRVGGARTMSITHIRELCDIADKYCGGYLRWTTRNNIEFMVDDEATMKALRDDLNSRKFPGGSFKFPVGGTGACVCNMIDRQQDQQAVAGAALDVFGNIHINGFAALLVAHGGRSLGRRLFLLAARHEIMAHDLAFQIDRSAGPSRAAVPPQACRWPSPALRAQCPSGRK